MKKFYLNSVVEAVKDFYKENYKIDLSTDEVNEMNKHDVLTAYLNWEGIYGYTWIIESIMED